MDRFVAMGANVWDIRTGSDYTTAIKGIEAASAFFKSMGIPMSLKEAGINFSDEEINDMAQKLIHYGPLGNVKKLYKPDIIKIISSCR
jgi:alcohol dehydrogenase YqhD (iron-dependent ADH family)